MIIDDLLNKYSAWAEQSIIDEVIILAITIAIVEAIAQNLIKSSGNNTDSKTIFGLSFYIIVGFLLHHAYNKFDLSKVNVIWSCISIVLATTLGYFIYNEHIGWKNILAVVLALGAVYFASS
jgi:multidrug transporter EmrE-like cation transporter